MWVTTSRLREHVVGHVKTWVVTRSRLRDHVVENVVTIQILNLDPKLGHGSLQGVIYMTMSKGMSGTFGF